MFDCLSNCKDLTGLKFGRLTVIRRGEDYISESTRRPRWICKCDCGNNVLVVASNLVRGTTTSCGCYAREQLSLRRTSHGGWANHERLYEVWANMRRRCQCKTCHNYDMYGGRGISVCDEWQDYSVFRSWAYASGYDDNAEFGECTIDRIDVNGNYEPSNCRWVNAKVQQNNKTSNIKVTYNGETHTLKEWSRLRNINYRTLYSRYKRNWEIARMLNFSD